MYSAVARAVTDTAGRDVCPVVLSGDCTTALGTVAGLQRAGADAGIVWFDAHGDVQTLETTASGYLGGLPLRCWRATGPSWHQGHFAAAGLRPHLEAALAS